jgi:hypothetical protein
MRDDQLRVIAKGQLLRDAARGGALPKPKLVEPDEVREVEAVSAAAPASRSAEEGDAVSRASPGASPPLSPSRPEPLDPPDDPGHDPTDERISKPLPVSRMKPRDTARLILARYVVDGVSRLRCQAGQFWLWEGGTYQRLGDAAITKLVSDFLDGARTDDGAMFHPKRRDVEEVLSALRIEAHLDDWFAAPCWLPGGEAATDWIVSRNGL